MVSKEAIEKKEGPNLIESFLGQITLPFFSSSKVKEEEEIKGDADEDKE